MPELRVRRDDLATCELVEAEAHEPAEGEAKLLVERFALTANNITYGVFGDQLGYWRLFPAPGPWGRIPAWGYSRVTVSAAPDVAEGTHVFGLVPMGSSFKARPAAHPMGFADTAPHRADLSPVYNQYLSVQGEGDDAQLVMRPLFGTSVVLDLVLSEAGFNGADRVILTSASCKTAYGLAHLLRDRPVEVVGVTSPARRDWVEGLGLYDSVLGYDDVETLETSGRAALVDFAGDRAILRRMHERLGEALVRSVLVGFTHRAGDPDGAPLPGPEPEFFFAPHEIVQRGRQLAERYAQAWPQFAPVAARAMRIERVEGGEGLLRVYRELLEGRADPAAGYVVSLP